MAWIAVLSLLVQATTFGWLHDWIGFHVEDPVHKHLLEQFQFKLMERYAQTFKKL